MSFEPRSLSGKYEADYPVLVELLEELSRGLQNTHIRALAAIEISKLHCQDLGTVTLSASEKMILHSLGVAPVVVLVRPFGNATWWESTRANRERIYLTASGTVSARVWVAA